MDSPGEFLFWLKQQVFQKSHCSSQVTALGFSGPELEKVLLLSNTVTPTSPGSLVCLAKKTSTNLGSVPALPFAPCISLAGHLASLSLSFFTCKTAIALPEWQAGCEH